MLSSWIDDAILYSLRRYTVSFVIQDISPGVLNHYAIPSLPVVIQNSLHAGTRRSRTASVNVPPSAVWVKSILKHAYMSKL